MARLTPRRDGRYARRVKRLELVRIKQCSRCGRGGAELRSADGDVVVVPLDPVRVRQLASDGKQEPELPTFTDVVLERFAAAGLVAREVVLDTIDGRLHAVLSLAAGAPDLVGCTAEEGVAVAVRGDLPLYATDEAIAYAARAREHAPRGAGGPGTLH